MTLRLGIVAGEPSGDALGARVVTALNARLDGDLVVEGIGGPALQAAGCRSLFPMRELAVMGLTEPLRRLPRLLRIRSALRQHFTAHPPHVFLGVDSPDFNLTLERQLRETGVPVAHLVSPSIWAWRSGRIKSIERSVDHMLHLFPFESAAYAGSGVPLEYVGHPLADDLPLASASESAQLQLQAREALDLARQGPVLALLPGSRESEVKAHGALFLETARALQARVPGLSVVSPVANAACEALLLPLIRGSGLPVTLCPGNAITALTAADVVLAASGTATLEAALVKRPMVVAYRTGAFSWAVLSRLVRTPYIALPNLLAGEPLVPEFLQHQATPETLAAALWQQLEAGQLQRLFDAFTEIHSALRCCFGQRTAAALLALSGRARHE